VMGAPPPQQPQAASSFFSLAPAPAGPPIAGTESSPAHYPPRPGQLQWQQGGAPPTTRKFDWKQ
jgi:hypothetical protein